MSALGWSNHDNNVDKIYIEYANNTVVIQSGADLGFLTMRNFSYRTWDPDETYGG
jgi:hypothetical protein